MGLRFDEAVSLSFAGLWCVDCGPSLVTNPSNGGEQRGRFIRQLESGGCGALQYANAKPVAMPRIVKPESQPQAVYVEAAGDAQPHLFQAGIAGTPGSQWRNAAQELMVELCDRPACGIDHVSETLVVAIRRFEAAPAKPYHD